MNDNEIISPISDAVISNKVLILRNTRVMLDKDLAALYGVTTGNLNKAVSRNIERFPDDFMFQVTEAEFESFKFQIGIPKRGGTRYLPYAFTEQGVTMLSAVLSSPTAIELSIRVVRAFVRLRQMVSDNAALRYAIEGLERRMGKNERDIKMAINAIQSILAPPNPPKKKIKMGFQPH